ncbi:MoaD/ThiS family protein [Rhodocaloribacter sp.]
MDDGTKTARMRLRVLVFSILREKMGCDAVTVALDAPATGADLLDRLERDYPALRAFRSVVRLAVNREYVPETTTLAEGDEVALITPVSGG